MLLDTVVVVVDGRPIATRELDEGGARRGVDDESAWLAIDECVTRRIECGDQQTAPIDLTSRRIIASLVCAVSLLHDAFDFVDEQEATICQDLMIAFRKASCDDLVARQRTEMQRRVTVDVRRIHIDASIH